VIIDSRENSSLSEAVITCCNLAGIKYEKKFIEIGDYTFGNVVIEAKSMSDFLASVRNKRIFNQISNMEDNYEKCYVIIYGHVSQAIEYLNTVRNMTYYQQKQWGEKLKRMVYGAFSAIAMNTNTTPIWVTSSQEAANIITAMRYNMDKDVDLQKMLPKKTRSDDVRVDILTNITGISVEKAKALLEQFGSVYEIAGLDIKDIMVIDGIGKVTASNILDALRSREEVKY